MISLASVPEKTFKDLFKLITTVLLTSKEEKKKTTSIATLLIIIPEDAGSYYPPSKAPAFLVDVDSIHLLFRFQDEAESVLLPIKCNLLDNSLSWWSTNPLPGMMRMIEKNVLERSNSDGFPGITGTIKSLQGVSVARMKSSQS